AKQLAGGLYGAWYILRFDPRAWSALDVTLAGFWASFVVAAMLAPFHALHVFVDYGGRDENMALLPYLIVETLAYIISWTLFPFAMLYASDFLDRRSQYFSHIVAYNWMRLFIEGPLYIVLLLSDFGAITREGAAFLNLIGLAALMVYGTFVAGVGLKVPTGTAVGLVVLDLVLSLTTALLIERI
ncbi:MAG: hypothetical protein RLN70_09845, partial [Rhodospirillaceae bacterium]